MSAGGQQSQPPNKIDGAMALVRTAWTEDRVRLAMEGLRSRRVRRVRRRQRALLGITLVLVGGAGGWGARRFFTQPASTLQLVQTTTVPPADGVVRLPDGSSAVPLGASDRVELVEFSAHKRRIRLVAGAARFAVAPDRARPFVVEAGAVTVEAIGTRFVVTQDGERVAVTMEEGSVKVTWPHGHTTLVAGQRGEFPPVASAGPVRRGEKKSSPTGSRQAWRSLGQRGHYEEAFEALSAAGPTAVPDEAGALLDAADVARLSGHPRQAVPHLTRMLNRFSTDPRAPFAAFTMGLVYLQELGRPGEAADAFARARRFQPSGILAEDALAREVEAAFRAGDTERAHRQAMVYVRLYPQGRRLHAVRRHGALE